MAGCRQFGARGFAAGLHRTVMQCRDERKKPSWAQDGWQWLGRRVKLRRPS